FWVPDKQSFEWAQDLRPGEHLLLADGREAPIEAISQQDENTAVYNLSISEIHTFYVGDEGTLVHNSCGTGPLSPDIQALAESHITSSGDTVLGRFYVSPTYIEKAEARGASYFDLGPRWNRLSDDEQWAANTHFLEIIAARGNRILLNIPKGEIGSRGYLPREIAYMTSKGYKWVNQWSMHPPGP